MRSTSVLKRSEPIHFTPHVGTEGNEFADSMAMLGAERKDEELRPYHGRNRYADAAQNAGRVIKKGLLPQRFVSQVIRVISQH